GGIRAGDWVWISLLAVIPGSGHLLMNWAHRIVDVSVSSVIGAGNPVFAVTAAWLVLHQSLRPIEIAGVVLALAGICAVAGRRRVPPAASIEPVADPP
ncbi:MAG: DMT family transporter, partial [Acidimicrobiales bacterium]